MKIEWSFLVLLGVAACAAEKLDDVPVQNPTATPAPAAAGSTGGPGAAPSRDAAVDAASDSADLPSAEPDAAELDAGEPDAATDPNADSVPPTAAWLVQCYEGAGDARISKVDTYCDALAETTIPQCDGNECEGSWSYTRQNQAYAALIAALDTNDDGVVDTADTPQRLALLGHSWGGTHAIDAAKKLRDDDRVAPSRKYVHLAVLFDPFRPFYNLTPSANTKRTWVLRQSDPDDDGCPASTGGLRYEGLRPRCVAGQECRDFDYSLSLDTHFPTQAGGSYRGGQIGHCRVPDVGFPVAVALLRDLPLPTLPGEVAVQAP